jgi:hypothetical protein
MGTKREYKNRLLEKLNLPGQMRELQAAEGELATGPDITEIMLDPAYLRQSSTLMKEALQKGFDVVQMENGDLVATGTRTIVYRFHWDSEKGRMVKIPVPQDEADIEFDLAEAE